MYGHLNVKKDAQCLHLFYEQTFSTWMFFGCKIQLVIRTMFYTIDILTIANYNNSTEIEFKKILLQQFKDNNVNKKNTYFNYRLPIYIQLHF